MPLVIVAVVLSSLGQPVDEPTDISFVAAVPMVVRAEPSAAAPVVGKLAPADIVMVYRAQAGWLRVDLLDKNNTKGWIATQDKDGMIPESWLDVRVRASKMAQKPWPQATKIDMLRKRVRVGFTEEQVRLALGDPTTKASDETATGVVSAWAYPGRIVTFKAGKVQSIKTIE